MLELARHDARFRSAYPADRLLVVFEIDGPIVDQRHMVRRRLLDYDRAHGTDHFRGVGVAEVDVDAGNLERFFICRGLPAMVRGDVLDAVPDHESLLQAVLLVPRSVTADFNLPEWNYYGPGSGERRRYHRYPSRQSTAVA